MADKISILVELKNDTSVKQKLRDIQALMDKLAKGVTIKVDTAHSAATERVLRSVEKDVETIVNKVDGLNRRTVAPKFDTAGLEKAVNETVDFVDAMNEAKAASHFKVSPDVSELERAENVLRDIDRHRISLPDVFNGLSSFTGEISSMLGNISQLFSFDLFGTVERTLTAYGTIMATQGLKNAVGRYDIMTTYDDYMQIMGVSAEVASASLDKVNEAIQGIPVGLDTAAQEIRMFTMYLQGTGDSMDDVADKATNLTIGLERALVAGGASEAMKTTAKYEVNRLLATGSLSTSRQWQALLNGLGVSGQYLKDVMGYGGLSTQDFIERLSSSKSENKISTDEFINGLAALADYEGLNKAIDVYKTTLEAGMYDIKFAMTRGFANTFTAINETLQSETGNGIRDYIQDLRVGINELFGGIQDWIREHPEVLVEILDRFNDVVQRAKDLDVGRLVERLVESASKMFDLFLKIYDFMPPGFWRELFVFSTTVAGPMSKMFGLASAVFGFLGKATGLLSKVPLLGKLFSLFSFGGKTQTVFTKGSIASLAIGIGEIAALGGVIYEYVHVLETVDKMQLSGNFGDNLAIVLTSVTAMGAIIAALTDVIAHMDPKTQASLAIGEGLTGGFVAIIGGLGLVIGKYADLAQDIAGLKLNGFGENMKKIAQVMAVVSALVVGGSAVIGGITFATGGLGGLAVAIGGIITEAFILEIQQVAGIILQFANVAETIATLYIPGNFDRKVQSFAKIMSSIIEALPAIETGDVQKAADYKQIFSDMSDSLISLNESANSLSQLEGKLNWLNRREGKFDEIKTNTVNLAEGVGEIFKTFYESFGGGFWAEFQSKHYPQIVENMGTAIGELSGLITNLQNIEFAIKQTGLDKEVIDEGLETYWVKLGTHAETQMVRHKTSINDPVKNLTDRLREILLDVQSVTDLMGEDWVKAILENVKTLNQSQSLQNIHTSLTAVKDIVIDIVELAQELPEQEIFWGDRAATEYRPGQTYNFGSMPIQMFKERFLGLVQTLDELFTNDSMESLKADALDANWAAAFANIKSAMGEDGIKGIVIALRNIADPLEIINDNNVTGNMGAMLSRLGTDIRRFGGDDQGEDVLKRAVFAKRAVDYVKELIENLSSISDKANELTSGDVSIGQKIATLLGDIFGSFNTEDAEAFSQKAGELQGVLESIKGLVEALASTELSGLNEELVTLADHLNNWINPFTDTLQQNLGNVAENARRASVQISALGTTMAYQHGHINTLMSDLSALVGSLGSVEQSAQRVTEALGSIPSNVSVNVTGNRSSSVLFPRLGFATGGPVGTDTIPAWLSEGEFVMRSKAVQTFGQQFMAQVNALNIPGALNALVRHYTLPQSAQVSNISNRDNHAVVNQYISTNNPNYTYARASKYVRAL